MEVCIDLVDQNNAWHFNWVQIFSGNPRGCNFASLRTGFVRSAGGW
jgi:hypothetical protein